MPTENKPKEEVVKSASENELARLKEQFAEQQKAMQAQDKQLQEMREKLSKQAAVPAPKQEREAQATPPKTEAASTNAGKETAQVANLQDIKDGGKQAREASLKASEESAKQAREAEQKAIDAYRNDEGKKIYQAKVDAGEVAPPADAPEEVRAKFRDAFETDRQKRWEEHKAVQMEATKQYMDMQPKKEAKASDEPANVDAPKPQPSAGGPAGATPGDNRSTGANANVGGGAVTTSSVSR